MKTSEVIHIFKGAISATKAAGVESVSVTDLEAYAARLEQSANETPEDVAAGEARMEKYRADLSAWISSRQQQHEYDLEMLRSVITVGQSALKSALLINGAASVALLAFIGQIWSANDELKILGPISVALLKYVCGVLSGAVSAGATYFSQAGYANEFGQRSRVIGRIGHVVAVLGVFGAYGLFACGSWSAYKAITGG